MAVPCEMLLHPELLSTEQLISVIRERHLHIPDLDFKRRDDLLELFHKYCVPYGQRKYRDSGRGKMLNLTRKYSPEPVTKVQLFSDSQYRKPLSLDHDRIKPPPDLLSGHLKRIKLDIKTQPVPDIHNTMSNFTVVDNNSKRKMSVDSVPAIGSPPSKKERKSITWP